MFPQLLLLLTLLLAFSHAQLASSAILTTPYASILTSATSNTPLFPNGTLNTQAWDNSTHAACLSALDKLTRATNPSGTALCYNIPLLHVHTGTFEADLRLYGISPQRGPWKDVAMEQADIRITYADADYQIRHSTAVSDNRYWSGQPVLLKIYTLSGKIKASAFSNNMSIAALQPLLLPRIAISIKQSPNSQLETYPSINEATFLTGVFSETTYTSQFSTAKGQVESAMDGLKAGEIELILPGVQILIFPIGLVITGAWTVLGVLAMGWGTFQRFRHRESYKRGVLRNMNRYGYEMTNR